MRRERFFVYGFRNVSRTYTAAHNIHNIIRARPGGGPAGRGGEGRRAGGELVERKMSPGVRPNRAIRDDLYIIAPCALVVDKRLNVRIRREHNIWTLWTDLAVVTVVTGRARSRIIGVFTGGGINGFEPHPLDLRSDFFFPFESKFILAPCPSDTISCKIFRFFENIMNILYYNIIKNICFSITLYQWYNETRCRKNLLYIVWWGQEVYTHNDTPWHFI